MLKIRLQRVGRKHDPSYRIVATKQQTGPKSNKHVAILGQYDSIRKTTTINDPEAIKTFIANGAQVSPRVTNILITEGIIEGKKINVLPRKSPIIKEPTEEELAAEAQAKEDTTAPAEEKTEDTAPAEEASTEEDKKENTPKEEKIDEKSEKKEESTE